MQDLEAGRFGQRLRVRKEQHSGAPHPSVLVLEERLEDLLLRPGSPAECAESLEGRQAHVCVGIIESFQQDRFDEGCPFAEGPQDSERTIPRPRGPALDDGQQHHQGCR